MLDKDRLQKEIYRTLHETLPSALENALKTTFPGQSEVGDNVAKQFGISVDEAISFPISQGLAGAIDYYIRNANIHGTIITVGSPVTQTAIIQSPVTITNGLVPNTFGIQ